MPDAPAAAIPARPWAVPAVWLAAVPIAMALLLFVNPDVFERQFYLNEVLSLMGLVALVVHPRLEWREPIVRAVAALLAYALLRLLLSPLEAQWPATGLADGLRVTLQQGTMATSVFAFFIGWAVAPYARRVWAQLAIPLGLLWVYTLLLVPITHAEALAQNVKRALPVNRFSAQAVLPLLSSTGLALATPLGRLPAPLPGLLLAVGLLLAFAVALHTETALLAALAVAALALLPRRLWWALAALALIGVVALAIAVELAGPRGLIEQIIPYGATLSAHPPLDAAQQILLRAGHSGAWRLVLAWQVIVDHWPQNLWGTGFGAPLLTYYPIDDYAPRPDLLPWTMSPHNSALAMLGRLGVIGAGLLLAVWYHALDHYLRRRAAWRAARLEPLAWALVVLVVVSLLNPFVDIPIHAGSHWFFIGLYAALARQVSTRVGEKNSSTPAQT